MSRLSRSNLYLAVVAANSAWFSAGHVFTWSSPILPVLLQPNDILLIDVEQSGWIASLVMFGAIFGPLLAGILLDRIGHKWTITLGMVCILVNWILLLFVRTIALMYTARIIGGVGGGIAFSVVPLYVAECAEVELRGTLGSLFGFFLNAGFLLPYVVGPYVSYSVLIICCMVAPLAVILTFPTFMPDTPYFLLRKGRDADALKSLSWLRKGASSEEVDTELHQMKESVNTSLLESGTVIDLFSTMGNRKALMISAGLLAGQQLSGINVVISYTQSIFLMTGSSLSPAVSSIILAVIQLLSAGIPTPLVARFGMKRPLIVSGISMGVFQGVLGLFFLLLQLGFDMSALNWLPITCLIGYIITYSIGFGPLPYAAMAEMFPPNIKAVGSAISASLCCFVGFLISKFFVDITDSLGEYFNFWMFAFFCFFMAIYTSILLPDTRGKSFDEIQDILNNRTKEKV